MPRHRICLFLRRLHPKEGSSAPGWCLHLGFPCSSFPQPAQGTGAAPPSLLPLKLVIFGIFCVHHTWENGFFPLGMAVVQIPPDLGKESLSSQRPAMKMLLSILSAVINISKIDHNILSEGCRIPRVFFKWKEDESNAQDVKQLWLAGIFIYLSAG